MKPLSFIDVNQHEYVAALLGLYEKNDVNKLVKLYVSAYKTSADRYSAVQQNMSEPNIFKLKYHNEIRAIIHDTIINNVTEDELVKNIKQSIRMLNLSLEDADKLFQLIELEIISLHEGNIARFRIRPSEFAAWKKSRER